MKRSMILAAAVLTAWMAGSRPAAASSGDVNFVIGERSLSNKDFWRPNENQTAFGVNVEFGPGTWPIHFVAGTQVSYAQNDFELANTGTPTVRGTFKSGLAEASLGLRWTINREGRTRFYIGGGASGVGIVAEVDVNGQTLDDNDRSFGGYVEGGVYWRLGSRFNIGVQARGLLGTNTMLDFSGRVHSEGDVDYVQGGLIFGWGWPGR